MIKVEYIESFNHWNISINVGIIRVYLYSIEISFDRVLKFKPDNSFLFFLLLAHPWLKPLTDRLTTDSYLNERVDEARRYHLTTLDETTDLYDPIPF